MTNGNWTWYVNGADRIAKVIPRGYQQPDSITINAGVVDTNQLEISYYLYDHLGNTRVVYSPEVRGCSVVDITLEYAGDYYPYGKILREYSNGEVERFLTTQHERDKETGLDYRGARFYDSDVARFLSLDPEADEYLTINPYCYVAACPVSLIDPDGKRIIYGGPNATMEQKRRIRRQVRANLRTNVNFRSQHDSYKGLFNKNNLVYIDYQSNEVNNGVRSQVSATSPLNANYTTGSDDDPNTTYAQWNINLVPFQKQIRFGSNSIYAFQTRGRPWQGTAGIQNVAMWMAANPDEGIILEGNATGFTYDDIHDGPSGSRMYSDKDRSWGGFNEGNGNSSVWTAWRLTIKRARVTRTAIKRATGMSWFESRRRIKVTRGGTGGDTVTIRKQTN